MEKDNIDLIVMAAKDGVRPEQWRYGQAIFNYAYDMYPNETNQLRGTQYDCFHNNDKVPQFLVELKKLINQ